MPQVAQLHGLSASDYEKRTIVNMPARETITFLRYSHETAGEYTRIYCTCAPAGGPPPHFHRSYSEKFTSVSGTLTITHNGAARPLHPGESVLVEPGEVHTFTNNGTELVGFEAEYRPGVPGLEKGFMVVFGLANDGLCAPDGPPKNPFRLALFSSQGMSDIQLTGAAGTVINPIVEGLARYARWMGWEKFLVEKYCKKEVL